jgi:hypothetical protein
MREEATSVVARSSDRLNDVHARPHRFSPIVPVSFHHEGMVYEALLSDVSQRGAQLQIPHYRPALRIAKGTELTIEMETPLGKSRLNGIVRWARSCAGRCQWGVEFTGRSRQPRHAAEVAGSM